MNFNIPADLALTADETDILIITGLAAFLQRIESGFLLFLGNWRYDRNEGIDYFGRVFGKEGLPSARDEFRTFLQSFPEIAEVKSLTLELDKPSGLLVVRYSVVTEDFGIVAADVAVPVLA